MCGKFRERGLLQGLALMLAVAAMLECGAAAAPVAYADMADAEARWLWGQQLSNGAFAYFYAGDGEVYINPYFASECAIALTRHDAARRHKAEIEAYLDWYLLHLNDAAQDCNGIAGTIYDYTAEVKNGRVLREESGRTYDSTDSYAALFLLALYAYSERYADAAFLAARAQGIRQVTEAMLSTMNGGYTYAKPDYEEYDLMDNCEVYAALKCAAILYGEVLNDAAAKERLDRYAAFYEENFAADWKRGDHYAAALSEDDFSWDRFYQCAVSQAFPVLFGLTASDSREADALYRRFCDAYSWETLEPMKSGRMEYYWGQLVLWGAMMGDTARVNAYLENYTAALAGKREYPLVGADAALVLIACDYMRDA